MEHPIRRRGYSVVRVKAPSFHRPENPSVLFRKIPNPGSNLSRQPDHRPYSMPEHPDLGPHSPRVPFDPHPRQPDYRPYSIPEHSDHGPHSPKVPLYTPPRQPDYHPYSVPEHPDPAPHSPRLSPYPPCRQPDDFPHCNCLRCEIPSSIFHENPNSNLYPPSRLPSYPYYDPPYYDPPPRQPDYYSDWPLPENPSFDVHPSDYYSDWPSFNFDENPNHSLLYPPFSYPPPPGSNIGRQRDLDSYLSHLMGEKLNFNSHENQNPGLRSSSRLPSYPPCPNFSRPSRLSSYPPRPNLSQQQDYYSHCPSTRPENHGFFFHENPNSSNLGSECFHHGKGHSHCPYSRPQNPSSFFRKNQNSSNLDSKFFYHGEGEPLVFGPVQC